MSLDVYLISQTKSKKDHSGIYIRENGAMVEISEEDWKRRFPDREPVRVKVDDVETDEVFWKNITHNLNKMANEAGLYEALWRPEEKGWKYAKDLITVLENGLAKLKSDPEMYQKFNPDNGWGSYEGLVDFVQSYLEACREYPDAIIEVSR